MSQLQREAVGLDTPADISTKNVWQALNDDLKDQPVASLPILRCDDAQFLRSYVTLSSIVSEMIHMYYAPTARTRMNSGKVLNLYHQLEDWYKMLPQILRLDGHAPPHLFILQFVFSTNLDYAF